MQSVMEHSGWSLSFDSIGDDSATCGDYFHAWSTDGAVGTLERTFDHDGTIDLTYANCGSDGTVEVKVNDDLVDSNDGTAKTYTQRVSSGDVLKIQDGASDSKVQVSQFKFCAHDSSNNMSYYIRKTS